MEVTKTNFYESLDDIFKSIEECSFMAIDGEFTGLDAQGYGHTAPFDTPAERYWKIRNGSTDFLLIQFGLCTFTVDAEKQRYEAKPYNFYIFPRPAHRHAPDRRFLCQSSSIDFLCSQGFDFNKLFKEGIPYLTPDQEARQRRDMEHKHSEATKLLSPGMLTPDSQKKSHMPVPPEQQAFVDKVCEQVDTYLQSDEKEPLALSPCNAFQRKLIYQTMETKFPTAHVETLTGEKKERYIMVHKTNNAGERLKKEIDKQAVEKMELDIQAGFTRVIEAITKSGKLVVGHNMMLDVIHSINQFQSYLPEDLDEFKTLVKSVFPRLLDTKLMASTHPFKDHICFTGLEELRHTLQDKPFSAVHIDLAEGFERYKDGGGAMHEAGYDAFVTGSCFTVMTKFLGQFQATPEPFLLPTSHVLEPFINKLFLMRIQDIPYLNLNGPDLNPSRPHVFHVTFPREWRASDIHSLFHPFGNVQISWLTDTTAFVALYKRDNADIATTALTSEVNSSYHVVTYDFHIKNSACHRASPNIVLTPSTQHKRKLPQADIEFPSPMVKRQKVADRVSPGPTIPESESETSTAACDGDIGEPIDTTKSSENTGSRRISKDEKTADMESDQKKLFEECSAW